MRVPRYEQQQTSLDVPNVASPKIPIPDISTSADMQNAKNLELIGKTVGDVTNVLSKAFKQREDAKNEQLVAYNFNNYRLAMQDVELGVLNRQLGDADRATVDFDQSWAKIGYEYSNAIKDPVYRAKLEEQIRNDYIGRRQRVIQHESTQLQKNNDLIFKDNMATSEKEASSWINPTLARNGISQAMQNQASWDKTNGVDASVSANNQKAIALKLAQKAVNGTLNVDATGEMGTALTNDLGLEDADKKSILKEFMKAKKDNDTFIEEQKKLSQVTNFKELVKSYADGKPLSQDDISSLANSGSIDKDQAKALTSALTPYTEEQIEGLGYKGFYEQSLNAFSADTPEQQSEGLQNILSSKLDADEKKILVQTALAFGKDEMAKQQLEALGATAKNMGLSVDETSRFYTKNLKAGMPHQEASDLAFQQELKRQSIGNLKEKDLANQVNKSLENLSVNPDTNNVDLASLKDATMQYAMKSGMDAKSASDTTSKILNTQIDPNNPEKSIQELADKLEQSFPGIYNYTGEIRQFRPTLWQSAVLKLEEGLRWLGVKDYSLASGKTSPMHTVASKFAQEASFGILAEDAEMKKESDTHPVASFIGSMAGGLSSLSVVSGALALTKLPGLAYKAGQVGAKALAAKGAIKLAEKAPRFIPRMIFSGSVFGAQASTKEVVAQLQNNEIDPVAVGAAALKGTVFGSSIGAVSGVASLPVASLSAGGIMFTAAKLDGADNQTAALSAAIGATYELFGGLGRNALLKKEAIQNISNSMAEWAMAKQPSLKPVEAKIIADQYIMNSAKQFGGIEKIINTKENGLAYLEALNVKIMQSTQAMPPTASQGSGASVVGQLQNISKTGVIKPEQPPAESTGGVGALLPTKQPLVGGGESKNEQPVAGKGETAVSTPTLSQGGGQTTRPQDFKTAEEYVASKEEESKKMLEETGDRLTNKYYYHVSPVEQTNGLKSKPFGAEEENVVWLQKGQPQTTTQGYAYAIDPSKVNIRTAKGNTNAFVHEGDIPPEAVIPLGKLGQEGLTSKSLGERLYKSEWEAANKAKGTRHQDFATAEEYVRSKMPSDVIDFRIGNKVIKVIKNPTRAEREYLVDRFNEKYPDAKAGEPKIRKTVDKDGNVYEWMSGDAVHADVEAQLKNKFGGDYNQNNDPASYKIIDEWKIKNSKIDFDKQRATLRGEYVDVVVAPSAKEKGKWQASVIQKDGSPSGDSVRDTFDEALDAGLREVGISKSQLTSEWEAAQKAPSVVKKDKKGRTLVSNKPAEVQPTWTEEHKQRLSEVESMASEWEAGGKLVPGDPAKDPNRKIRLPSTFPPELQNIGLEHKQMNALFKNIKIGKPLTQKQIDLANMLLDWHKGVFDGQTDTSSISEARRTEIIREGNQDEPISEKDQSWGGEEENLGEQDLGSEVPKADIGPVPPKETGTNLANESGAVDIPLPDLPPVKGIKEVIAYNLGTKKERLQSFLGTEKGRRAFEILRQMDRAQSMVDDALVTRNKEIFKGLSKPVREYTFDVLKGIQGVDPDGSVKFGALQRAGIVSGDYKQGQVLEDGRVIGERMSDMAQEQGIEPTQKSFKEFLTYRYYNTKAEYEKLIQEHPKAKDVIAKYIADVEDIQRTAFGDEIPAFARNVMKQQFKINSSAPAEYSYVPGVMKDRGIVVRMMNMIRGFTASGRKFKTGALAESGLEEKDFAKALTRKQTELAYEKIHNNAIGDILVLTLEPIEGKQVKPGYTELNMNQPRMKKIIELKKEELKAVGIDITKKSLFQYPSELDRELKMEMPAVFSNPTMEEARVALQSFGETMVNGITTNYLIRPSTAVRNLNSGFIQYSLRPLSHFYEGIMGEGFTPLIADIKAPFQALMPWYNKAIPRGALGKIFNSGFDNKQSIFSPFLVPFRNVEFFFKKSVFIAEMNTAAERAYAQNPTVDKKQFFEDFYRNSFADMFQVASDNTHSVTFDYWDKPLLLEKLPKWAAPYPNYFYHKIRMYGEYSPIGMIGMNKTNAKSKIAKALAGLTLMGLAWKKADEVANDRKKLLDALAMKRIDINFDTIGRILFYADEDTEKWLRIYDLPFIGDMLYAREMLNGSADFSDWVRDTLALGPVLAPVLALVGLRSKYQQGKGTDSILGESVAGFIPFGAYIRYLRVLADPIKRETASKDYNVFENFMNPIIDVFPVVSRALPEDIIKTGYKKNEARTYDIDGQTMSLLFSNIKSINKAEFAGYVGEQISSGKVKERIKEKIKKETKK